MASGYSTAYTLGIGVGIRSNNTGYILFDGGVLPVSMRAQVGSTNNFGVSYAVTMLNTSTLAGFGTVTGIALNMNTDLISLTYNVTNSSAIPSTTSYFVYVTTGFTFVFNAEI